MEARQRSHMERLSGAQASVSVAPGIVEDATGFCSDTAALPNRWQENRCRSSFPDYYRNGRNKCQRKSAAGACRNGVCWRGGASGSRWRSAVN